MCVYKVVLIFTYVCAKTAYERVFCWFVRIITDVCVYSSKLRSIVCCLLLYGFLEIKGSPVREMRYILGILWVKRKKKENHEILCLFLIYYF